MPLRAAAKSGRAKQLTHSVAPLATLAVLGLRATHSQRQLAFTCIQAPPALKAPRPEASRGVAAPISRGFHRASLASSAAAFGASVAFTLASRSRSFVSAAQQRPSTQAMAEKTPVQTQIEQVIALHPVVIFSKTTCPFCAKAKDALKEIGMSKVPTIELDTLEPAVASQIQDHLLTLTGARSVPRVFIGRKCIGGGDETTGLAASGELKPMVDAAVSAHRKDLAGDDISKIQKSEEEWFEELGPELYQILRKRGTERPGSHEYDQFYPEKGHFSCAGCNLPLYSSSSKFRSSCGWPVFDKCYHSQEWGTHVATRSDGTGSLEIVCPKCGGHLGHVFFDSQTAKNPNGERH